jgi:RND family efflux transporter MFP subunit
VLDATGYVVARRQATVSAKTTGKVSEMLMEEGMRVAEGEIIARLDDTVERAELALAQAQLDAARSVIRELDAELRHAGRTLERTRALAARGLVSDAELDAQSLTEELLRARRDRAHRDVAVAERRLAVQRHRLADMEIRAPFAGVVVDKAAQPGEMVSPISAGGGFTRTGLGTIVDMLSLEVEVDVNEAYIHRVHAAQAVSVVLNAFPDVRYPAEVLAVIPTADRSKATVGVRVGFIELDQRVLPNMSVRVAFLATGGSPEEDGS